MKKALSLLISLLLACGCALAESPLVSVTISDGQGNIVMANAEIELTNADGDGALTVYDALFAAHETGFDGGAAAGFAAEDQGYGLSITRLWGEENGGSYGYCVNDASAYSLADPLADGDNLHAYVYTDLEAWSDTYCYFDAPAVAAAPGEAVALTLTALTYDADWNAVPVPVEGATILIDGAESDAVTAADGTVSLSFESAGSYLISARSADLTLVPPVCTVTVAEAE